MFVSSECSSSINGSESGVDASSKTSEAASDNAFTCPVGSALAWDWLAGAEDSVSSCGNESTACTSSAGGRSGTNVILSFLFGAEGVVTGSSAVGFTDSWIGRSGKKAKCGLGRTGGDDVMRGAVGAGGKEVCGSEWEDVGEGLDGGDDMPLS